MPNSTPIRFGIFEVDLAARELRRRGVRVRLQEQPFRVLEALLERPGEVVTREKLRERLWAKDEYVEFDASLNTAVQKIRQALGDSAENPKFIETLPRVDYRFLPADVVSQQQPSPQPRPAWRPAALVASALALLGLAAGFLWRPNPAPSEGFDPASLRLRRLTFDDGLAYQPDISPDGRLVVYASDRAGNGDLDIWLQQTSGGDPIALTSLPGDELEPSFSPDGSQIAFRSAGTGSLYVVSALGGTPRPIAGTGRRPRFSPDGSRIAYWVGKEHMFGNRDSQIFWVPTAGGPPVNVGFGRSPVWSPDGSRLLCLRGSGDWKGWALLDADGGDTVRTRAVESLRDTGLDDDPEIIGSDNFVPDRWLDDGRVLFAAGRRGALSVWSLQVSPRTGEALGEPRRLTRPSSEHRTPSAADSRLVFADIRTNVDIWILPIADTEPRHFGDPYRATSNGATDDKPSLSADGTLLAFRSERSGAPDVWTKDLGTGELKQLTSSDKAEGSIIAHRNGRQILYSLSHRIGGGRLAYSSHAVATADNRVQPLCENCGAISDWSPSGRFLIGYARSAAAEKAGMNGAVTLTDLQDGTARILFENQPEWRFAADERWLAFHNSTRGGEDIRQIFVAELPVEGRIRESDLIPVTSGDDNSFQVAWSHDDRSVYFLSDRDGYRCIYEQPLEPPTKRPTGPPQEVLHVHSARTSMSWFRNTGRIGISVVRDKVAFAMAERTSEIWIMEPTDAE